MQESVRGSPPPPGFPKHLLDLESLIQNKIPCSSKCGKCGGGAKSSLCSTSVFNQKLEELSELLPKMRRDFSKLDFNLESFIFIMYMSMFRIHFGFNSLIPRPKIFAKNPKDAIKILRANRNSIFQSAILKYCFAPRVLCNLVLGTQPDGKGCCLSKQHWKFLFPELKDDFPVLSLSYRSEFLTRSIGLNFIVAQLIPDSCLSLQSWSSLRYSLARRVLNSMQKSAPVPAPAPAQKPNLDWRIMFPF
jgi:hypothetical protein